MSALQCQRVTAGDQRTVTEFAIIEVVNLRFGLRPKFGLHIEL